MIANSTIESLRSKDPAAQKKVFEQYGSFLYRVAYRYVRDRMTAEDLVVDAFLKIFEGAHNLRFDNLRSFEAWMKKIVVNEALMLLRKQASFQLMPESEAIEIGVDDNVLDNISSDEIYQLIAELPDGYRTIFNLFAIEGFSHKEIAEQLGINEGTSKSQLNHARKLLQKKILLRSENHASRRIL
ncbi:RNA polymerase, sigma-24 subunit, ECF subfamily [Emticicia oligotrophica DSM 17448]|uniref:RNA polymerase, sigma-24 subunit, ECF subfamily n=1 Tax=Emticicia oligotrophica (strain DSM 17448 / CIP 109782 / MTCC 6937 / GPTSA100-15) TaxID=929562 RepID=A0ABN4AQP0_EMTOG|nr:MULTISPECIES: sigma-70 family RNA polymerase sigma factor [Emticicia]AFK03584.1 RNA polymerase, sigma-24 subunit, ECF subfamily [Emticicia oligotrophica DSM 17448]